MNEKEMTRYRLAKECGISQSTVKRMFDLDQIPSVETLYKVLEVLEINPYYIYADMDSNEFLWQ